MTLQELSLSCHFKCALIFFRVDLDYHLTVITAHVSLKFESENSMDALWIEAHKSIHLVPDLKYQTLQSAHLTFHGTIDLLKIECLVFLIDNGEKVVDVCYSSL